MMRVSSIASNAAPAAPWAVGTPIVTITSTLALISRLVCAPGMLKRSSPNDTVD